MEYIEQFLAALRGVTWLRYVVAPLLGAVIGYLTNDLAIRMLFRPYEEKRIGRFHVPFTPGLIPQQKSRIAKSLGGVIAGKLLDADTLRREALSEAVVGKLRGAITGWLESQAANGQPLRERLGGRFGDEKVQGAQEAITGRASELIMDKLRGAGLGEIVADQVLGAIRGKLAHMPMGFLFEGALEPMRASIASSVERKLSEAGPELVRAKLTEAGDELLDRSVAELAEKHRERIPELTEALLRAYRELFDSRIGALLDAVHLDDILERKIDSFDARELETVIFEVAHRELRAIVYLGALLGFLMGFINLLF